MKGLDSLQHLIPNTQNFEYYCSYISQKVEIEQPQNSLYKGNTIFLKKFESKPMGTELSYVLKDV